MVFPIHDLSSIIIDEANERFGQEYKVADELNARYKSVCDRLDEALKDVEPNAFHISVDEKTMEIRLEIVLPGIWRKA